MSYTVNESHNSQLRCWVASAHNPNTDFPIQNLPFGVFRRADSDEAARVGVAIGDQILDLSACLRQSLFDGLAAEAAQVCDQPTLNALLALGRSHWSALRQQISAVLREDGQAYQRDQEIGTKILLSMHDAELLLPVQIGDYTDFYASVHHATNVGSMFRPDNPLLPNYKYVPIGYHGRASSVVVSGAPVQRPNGQTRAPQADAPSFGPCKLLDYEMEIGLFVGPGNTLGQPIPIDQAEEQIFGLCLVNDWSARDIQTWEYQPLGPFLAKSFVTTISPWIVTLEALAPFRVPAFKRASDDPQPLSYLDSSADREQGGIDLTVEVYLASQQMRDGGVAPQRLSRGSFANMYWTIAQMLTHHASNGCNLRPGDLLASGTVSGASRDERGCLLELTWRGAEPIELPSGETRTFLQDGDEIILRGYCERADAARIGFGESRGVVQPAVAQSR
ncbi:MAG: fumarylacetoacetase [Chloroflexi bacterium]|nr:fumarylacetoacetase [Chloroflexota bacterium]